MILWRVGFMGKDMENYSEEIFENIKHINEYGQEFWYARELREVLNYTQWRLFKETIDRAKEACKKVEMK